MQEEQESYPYMDPIISRADMAVAFMRLALAQLDGSDSDGAADHLRHAIHAVSGKSEFLAVLPHDDDQLRKRYAAQVKDIW
jgi:hypothetical protein